MAELSNDILNKRKHDLEENLKVVRERINQAAFEASRDPSNIKLLAATKTVEPELINHAISLGVNLIGENRVQELLEKYDGINKENIDIHFIGHLQRNKVKKIVGKVSMIESVDSIELANEIASYSKDNDVKTDVLIEVNIGREENKSGVFPEELESIFEQMSLIDNINIRGLMAIPPVCTKKEDSRKYFSQIYKLFIDIKQKKLDNGIMDVLSMGMSNDYYEAILEGASVIRIGSFLFGSRK